MNYYNEPDVFAAQWIRNLIADGQLLEGTIDERTIEEVKADDWAEKVYKTGHRERLRQAL